MNVLSIVRARWPSDVPPPLNLSSDIYSFTLFNAPSTRPTSALNPVPFAILLPLRGSWEPELKRVVAFLTEVNILFTSLFICSTSVRETVVFWRTSWANTMTSLAFLRTSFVVSCSGTSEIAACNWSADNFSDSFLSEIVLSASLSSEAVLLSLISVLFSVAVSWTLLDSLVAFDKVAKSADKSSFSSFISFWTASALSSNAWALWTLSFTEESTESSRFNLVERREFNSSTTVLNWLLSTVLLLFSTSAVSLFSKELLTTSELFSVGSLVPTGESPFSLGCTTPAVDCELFPLTVSALATRAPKNISAATATEAAPKLYLRIEKRRTFSRWWRFTLLSEFDLFSIFPPYVKTQNQIKKQFL